MSSVTDIERNLAEAEHQQELYSDNERIIANQITDLRRRLIAINQDEQQSLARLRQPLERKQSDTENERKAYERARDKFHAAEVEFKKAEDRWRQHEADHGKSESDVRHKGDLAVKQFEIERRKVEQAIEHKEREEAQTRANRINAERTTTLLRKRLEDARRQEVEQLHRKAANVNKAPTSSARYGTYR